MQANKVIPILMPKAGNVMEEGTMTQWLVEVGTQINEGDIIFEIETDKAAIEVEATDSGRLARIAVQEGQTVPVHEPVAYIADSDADVDDYLAAQRGPAGEQADRSSTVVPPATSDAGTKGRGSKSETKPVSRTISPMRKAIAKSLVASKQTIPHFYMDLTIDASSLYNFYQEEKANHPCTLNDIIILACAKVIQDIPIFRSRLNEDEIVEYPSSNIGIAVGLDDGLLVPVLVGVERMNLAQVGAESKRIIDLARKGKVTNVGQGVFTVSNIGMYGVERFSAIINPPETAILAVGAIREDAIVKDGAVRAGRVMTMTLSADHRLVDGVLAADFLGRLRQLLERPTQLL